MSRHLLCGLIAAISSMAYGRATAGSILYTVTNVGNPSSSSFAYAINSSGEVVGGYGDGTDAGRAFSWKDGVLTNLVVYRSRTCG